MLAETLPNNAFYGKGTRQGSTLLMIDDGSSEREPFQELWPNTTILMCAFHFL